MSVFVRRILRVAEEESDPSVLGSWVCLLLLAEFVVELGGFVVIAGFVVGSVVGPDVGPAVCCSRVFCAWTFLGAGVIAICSLFV